MSTDNPYVTGFLEEIIDVHFGSGLWLGITTGVDPSFTPPSVPDVNIAMRISAADGLFHDDTLFTFYTAGHANTEYPAVATIVKPNSTFITSALTKLTGYVVQGGALINIPPGMPNTFTVSCSCSADTTPFGADGGGVTVCLLLKTTIVPGQDVFTVAEGGLTMTAHRNFFGPGGTALTFTVNIGKKTVVGSGGTP